VRGLLFGRYKGLKNALSVGSDRFFPAPQYKYWKSASSTATIPSTKPRLQQIKAAKGGADARHLLTFCYTFF
jgi:hypothetical protein